MYDGVLYNKKINFNSHHTMLSLQTFQTGKYLSYGSEIRRGIKNRMVSIF